MSPTHANKLGVRIMCRMRFCRIEGPKQTASLACRPPRLRPLCATASAGTLDQWVKRSSRPPLWTAT